MNKQRERERERERKAQKTCRERENEVLSTAVRLKIAFKMRSR